MWKKLFTLLLASLTAPAAHAHGELKLGIDPNNVCLVSQRMSPAEDYRTLGLRADLSHLNRLRDGSKRRDGHTYSSLLAAIEAKYLDQTVTSDAYKDRVFELLLEEKLRAKLHAVLGDMTLFNEALRSIQFNLTDARPLTKALIQIDQRVLEIYGTELSQVDAGRNVTGREALSYMQKVGERDELRTLISLVHANALKRMNLRKQQVLDEIALFNESAIWTLGTATVVVSAVTLFQVSVTGLALASLTRAYGLAVGARTTGAMLGGAGEGAASLLVSRTDNLVQAGWDSQMAGTSFACELRRNQHLNPSNSLLAMAKGVAIGVPVGMGTVALVQGARAKFGDGAVRKLVKAIPLIVGTAVTKEIYMAQLHGRGAQDEYKSYELARQNYIAYRFSEQYSLAREALAESNKAAALEHLQQAQALSRLAAKDVLNGMIESAILFTARGEVKHALKELSHGMEEVLAFVSKTADNTVVALENLAKTYSQLKGN